MRCSIHHWAEHGIAGRGVLLDYRHYALTHNKPYDPYTSHAITLDDLKACASPRELMQFLATYNRDGANNRDDEGNRDGASDRDGEDGRDNKGGQGNQGRA